MGISIMEMRRTERIQQYRADMGFSCLVESVCNDAIVIPECKRKFRWEKRQVEDLAFSLIRGFPIQPIYTYRNEDGRLEIVDGSQRVIALCLYHMGKFLDRSTDGGVSLVDTSFYIMDGEEEIDISYSNLPNRLKEAVDYTTIPLVEIKISNQEKRGEILHKIFTNLNS